MQDLKRFQTHPSQLRSRPAILSDVTSVIIPAHNEARVLGRLLDSLTVGADTGLKLLVVCNGCTDDTADVARGYGAQVEVIELEAASKHLALVEGDTLATDFPRLYVDADIEMTVASALALVEALSIPGVLAVAPERWLILESSSPIVRAYYRVWMRLPAVLDGLFGRGVLGVNEHGYSRIFNRPAFVGDDNYLNSRFTSAERLIVPSAISKIYAPRTTMDLLRRRVRATEGNTELATATDGSTNTTVTSMREVARLAHRRLRDWPSLAVFVLITIISRIWAKQRARSRQPTTWLRDESSRSM